MTYDDAGGAFTATTYLIAQGYRRIDHLIGDLLAELGRRAADLILRLTTGSEGAAQSETVPLELVRRGTA